jgi:O-methyltransferase
VFGRGCQSGVLQVKTEILHKANTVEPANGEDLIMAQDPARVAEGNPDKVAAARTTVKRISQTMIDRLSGKPTALLSFRNMLSLALRWSLWFTPLRRYMYHRYSYNFMPEQLAYFVDCLNRTRDVPGVIFEVGCAGGATTVFLNKHLSYAGIEKKYICIDTFGGFTAKDVSWEVFHRGKANEDFSGFGANSVHWFRYTMKRNSCDRVRCVPIDVQGYDFLESISFCLVDVDLYRPTLYVLERTWPLLQSGGVMIVDDCIDRSLFDGAFQAYAEFTQKMNLPENIVLGKLGVLQKL